MSFKTPFLIIGLLSALFYLDSCRKAPYPNWENSQYNTPTDQGSSFSDSDPYEYSSPGASRNSPIPAPKQNRYYYPPTQYQQPPQQYSQQPYPNPPGQYPNPNQTRQGNKPYGQPPAGYGSKDYSNPYDIVPSPYHQPYDSDNYYVPPIYQNNIEPLQSPGPGVSTRSN